MGSSNRNGKGGNNGVAFVVSISSWGFYSNCNGSSGTVDFDSPNKSESCERTREREGFSFGWRPQSDFSQHAGNLSLIRAFNVSDFFGIWILYLCMFVKDYICTKKVFDELIHLHVLLFLLYGKLLRIFIGVKLILEQKIWNHHRFILLLEVKIKNKLN